MEITLFKTQSNHPKAPAFSGFMEAPDGRKIELVGFVWKSEKTDKHGNQYEGIRILPARKS